MAKRRDLTSLPVLSAADLLKLHEAVTAAPELRGKMDAIEKLRREWERDRDDLERARKRWLKLQASEWLVIPVTANRLLKDVVLFGMFRLALRGAELVMDGIALRGHIGETLTQIHEWATAACYALLCWWMVADALKCRRSRVE